MVNGAFAAAHSSADAFLGTRLVRGIDSPRGECSRNVKFFVQRQSNHVDDAVFQPTTTKGHDSILLVQEPVVHQFGTWNKGTSSAFETHSHISDEYSSRIFLESTETRSGSSLALPRQTHPLSGGVVSEHFE